jgi:hypothetical protein
VGFDLLDWSAPLVNSRKDELLTSGDLGGISSAFLGVVIGDALTPPPFSASASFFTPADLVASSSPFGSVMDGLLMGGSTFRDVARVVLF